MDGTNTILITGANGFFGRAIVSRLLASGIDVCATDLEPSNCRGESICVKADILNRKDLKRLFYNVRTVVHVAGLAHIFSPDANAAEKFRQVNEIGTINVASEAAASGVHHLILISSVSVYGLCTGIVDEKTPCNPVGPYALSKRNAELRAIEIARESGFALTILRLATLYGEGDPGNISRLIRSIERGRFIWIGKGMNTKSLLHCEDAAKACLAVVKTGPSGINIYNVSAPPRKMSDIVAAITRVLGRRVPSWYIPGSFALNTAKAAKTLPFISRKVGVLHNTIQKWLANDSYSGDKFCRTFDFETEISLEDGIRREVVWHQNRSYRSGRK
jgi:nucleoside-diphosphate-sugar epimerase